VGDGPGKAEDGAVGRVAGNDEEEIGYVEVWEDKQRSQWQTGPRRVRAEKVRRSRWSV
jgi:hypothetical protein